MLYEEGSTIVFGAGELGMRNLLQEIKQNNMFPNQLISVLSLIECNTVSLKEKHPGVNFVTSKISDVTADEAQLPHNVEEALSMYQNLCESSGVIIIHCKSGVHRTGLLPLIHKMQHSDQHWRVIYRMLKTSRPVFVLKSFMEKYVEDLQTEKDAKKKRR